MMRLLRKIDHGLAVAEKVIAVALFFALVASITVNIVARNVFQVSFQMLLEIGPALVLWLALIGSTLALRENRHIRIRRAIIISNIIPKLNHVIWITLFNQFIQKVKYRSSSGPTNIARTP
jgi:TRAP-type C4-dicarboxylate transport system permease small subunit